MRLLETAKAKMRSDGPTNVWPNLDGLRELSTHDFTLAFEAHGDSEMRRFEKEWRDSPYTLYTEFDKTAGAFPDLLRRMRGNLSRQDSSLSSSPASPIWMSEVERYNSTFLIPHLGSTPAFDRNASWQETDNLTDKTIPFYNFTLALTLTYDGTGSLGHIMCLPRAQKSTGAIMRDCPMCYCHGGHCGYHSIPDFTSLPSVAKQQFADLSFNDMLEAAEGMLDLASDDVRGNQFFRVLTVQQYMRWPELVAMPSVDELKDAVLGQTFGKAADKVRFKIWALVYRGIWTRYN
jgi:hypothetical protein